MSTHPQPGGACVLRRADLGRYARLSADEWAAIAGADGTRTAGELVRLELERRDGIGLRRLLDLVGALRSDGFLVPGSGPSLVERRRGTFAIGKRLVLPGSVRGHVNVFAWSVVASLAVLSSIASLLLVQLDRRPLRIGGIGALWLGLVVILSLRSVVNAVVLVQAGTRPWQLGFAWTWVVPHLWADPRDIAVAGLRGRAALALSDFSVAALGVVLGYATWQLHDPAAGAAGVLVASGLLFWFARPFGRSPLVELLVASTGSDTIWRDARAWLQRRMLKRGGEVQWPVVVVALSYPLWFYAALAWFGDALESGLVPAVLAVTRAEGTARAEAALLVVTFAGVMLASAVIPLGIGLRLLRQRVRESRRGTARAVEPGERESIVQALMNTPLFASLPRAALEGISARGRLIKLSAQAFAVRQGEDGDAFFVVQSGQLQVLIEQTSGRRDVVARLDAGDGFGELALMGDGKRRASVQAVAGCTLVSIDRESFSSSIEAAGVAREDVTRWLTVTRELRRSTLFSGMTATEIARFIRRARVRPLAAGEVLIREGEPGDAFYICLQGKLRVTRAREELAILGPGNFAGEMALLSSGLRVATVTALEPGEVLVLGREAFLDTLAKDFAFGLRVSDTARARRELVEA